MLTNPLSHILVKPSQQNGSDHNLDSKSSCLTEKVSIISTIAATSSKLHFAMILSLTATSSPIPFKKPAHSKETYEAPMQSVFPGEYLRANKSSLNPKYNLLNSEIYLDMQYSLAPGTSGNFGRNPVAIRNLSAVSFSCFPFLSVHVIS